MITHVLKIKIKINNRIYLRTGHPIKMQLHQFFVTRLAEFIWASSKYVGNAYVSFFVCV
jgi:hypothetical protein